MGSEGISSRGVGNGMPLGGIGAGRRRGEVGSYMGGPSMNLDMVNGVGPVMPPHVEAEFRRFAEELIEVRVNKGTSEHVGQRCAEGTSLEQMAHWKIQRTLGEIGDDDDISGMSSKLAGKKTFRMAMDWLRKMPAKCVVALSSNSRDLWRITPSKQALSNTADMHK